MLRSRFRRPFSVSFLHAQIKHACAGQSLAQVDLYCGGNIANTVQILLIKASMMLRRAFTFAGLAAAMAACTSGVEGMIGSNGLPLPQIYDIEPGSEGDIQFRMLDSVNTLRQAAGVPAVQLDPRLNAAALTHSRDMSRQNRPWLFGSDGSSPLDRVRRVGFTGQLLGENISESYETEIETLAAWMNQSNTRSVILDPNARLMGFAWYQEPAGKLWWTMNMGSNPAVQQANVALQQAPVVQAAR